MSPNAVLSAWQFRREIAMVAGALLALVFIFVAAVSTIFTTVPLASDEHIAYYEQAAQELQSQTGLSLDFRYPLVVDAIRLRQDFSGVTPDSARMTADLFVETTEHEEEPCEEGAPGCTCTLDAQANKVCTFPAHETHRLRTLDQVMERLAFTGEEREMVLAMVRVTIES